MFRFKNVLIFICVLLFTNTYGQKNAIKTGFLGALGGDYSLSYERMITESNSIQFKIGYWNPTASLIFTKNSVTPNAYEFQDMTGGINTSMEYRIYMADNTDLNGLYLAPYLRFVNLKALYSDEIDKNIFDVHAKIRRFGLGAKIGHQWFINDAFVIELFGGLGLDRYYVERDYVSKSVAFTDYSSIVDDVNDWIDDWDYLKKREEHEVSSSNLLSKLPFLFPGIEFGVNIGFGF